MNITILELASALFHVLLSYKLRRDTLSIHQRHGIAMHGKMPMTPKSGKGQPWIETTVLEDVRARRTEQALVACPWVDATLNPNTRCVTCQLYRTLM